MISKNIKIKLCFIILYLQVLELYCNCLLASTNDIIDQFPQKLILHLYQHTHRRCCVCDHVFQSKIIPKIEEYLTKEHVQLIFQFTTQAIAKTSISILYINLCFHIIIIII